jgi:hypothetical protein
MKQIAFPDFLYVIANMFWHLLAILKKKLGLYPRVRRNVEKLISRKVTLTFDLDLWRQRIKDVECNFKGIWCLALLQNLDY